jgi:drug/metabolite transporter (DMT)-like permease
MRLLKERQWGFVYGIIGVIIFSVTLPATEIALVGFSPMFVAFARLLVAGLAAIYYLYRFQPPRPNLKQWVSLYKMGIGIAIGFPVLSSIALAHANSAHGAVLISITPLMTAVFAVFLIGERPSLRFWMFAASGVILITVYSLTNQGVNRLEMDLAFLGASVSAAYGYAQGGRLSRSMDARAVIAWSLVGLLPLAILMTVLSWPPNLPSESLFPIVALVYLGLFSMFIGFFFWYEGLSRGGIAKVGQLQLLQPFFTLALSVALLGQSLRAEAILFLVLVLICVIHSQKSPVTERHLF